MATEITLKQDNTEPIEFTLDADNISDLDDLNTARLYARRDGATSNHVDGVALSIQDSAAQTVRFDPVGNAADGGDAFDETGVYKCYVKADWSDGDTTRHPDEGFTVINIEGHYE